MYTNFVGYFPSFANYFPSMTGYLAGLFGVHHAGQSPNAPTPSQMTPPDDDRDFFTQGISDYMLRGFTSAEQMETATLFATTPPSVLTLPTEDGGWRYARRAMPGTLLMTQKTE